MRLGEIYLACRARVLGAAAPLLRRRPPRPEEPRRILMIGPARLGDAAMSLHLPENLRARFPTAVVAVLTPPYPAPLYRLGGAVHEVRTEARGLLHTLRMIREDPVDLLIDASCDTRLRYALLARLSGAGRSVGFDIAGRGAFFDVPVPLPPPDRHISAVFLELLEASGIAAVSTRPRLRVDPGLTREGLSLLRKAGVRAEERLVLLHPGGHHPSQRWPRDRYLELAGLLREDGGVAAALVLGPAELREDAWAQGLTGPGAVPTVAPRGVGELVGILSCADLLVCNNSGPLNLAVAMGIPTVSFMGPTRSPLWAPPGPEHTILRRNDLDCLGCNRPRCRRHDMACMKGITVEDAYRACRERLTAGEAVR